MVEWDDNYSVELLMIDEEHRKFSANIAKPNYLSLARINS